VCLLLREEETNGKEDKSMLFCELLLLIGSERKKTNVWSKILEHSFMGEFAFVVCLSFSDLWVCFGDGFQTKKMVLCLLV
jgi:hypothetical protein